MAGHKANRNWEQGCWRHMSHRLHLHRTGKGCFPQPLVNWPRHLHQRGRDRRAEISCWPRPRRPSWECAFYYWPHCHSLPHASLPVLFLEKKLKKGKSLLDLNFPTGLRNKFPSDLWMWSTLVPNRKGSYLAAVQMSLTSSGSPRTPDG